MNTNHTDVSCVGQIASEATEPWSGNYFVSTYPPFSQWSPDDVSQVERVLAKKAQGPVTPLGLYVHIPFCAKRCDYCYYLSFADKSQDQYREYVDALLNELALYRKRPLLAGRRPRFIYFGGGTPSLLDETSLRALLEGIQRLFSWDDVEEATFECAPRSATTRKLQLLREAGVTRLSLGVQSLDDEVLRLNGRVHVQKDIALAYRQIRFVGFDVVNLDLIVGLPGESDESIKQTLEGVIAMAPESVTIYQLEIPHNTPLFRAAHRGEPPAEVPPWQEKRSRLALCFERLESAGYSIRSGYAALRDPNQHRFIYQDAQYHGADLLGIGLSSFSYLAGVHHQNQTDFDAYVEAVSRGELPVARAHHLRSSERLVRELILHLKLGHIDAAYFADKFGADILERFKNPLRRFSERGWLATDATGVRVTREGLLRIDRLLPAFYLPRHRGVRYT